MRLGLAAFVLILFVAFAAAQDTGKLLNSARILIKNKDFEGAKALLLTVQENDPVYAESLVLAARCEEGLGNIPAAIDAFRKAEAAATSEQTKAEALAGMDRLDEGKRILRQHAAELLKEAEKYRGKNELAVQTLVSAAELLMGDVAVDRASGKLMGRQPPADAVEWRGGRYKLYPAGLTWHEARDRCEELGGQLVCTETAEEYEFVDKLASVSRGKTWLGLLHRDGKWVWLSGRPVTWARWSSGFPEKVDGPSYGVIRNTGDGRMANVRGTDTHRSFVCEWPPTAQSKPK